MFVLRKSLLSLTFALGSCAIHEIAQTMITEGSNKHEKTMPRPIFLHKAISLYVKGQKYLFWFLTANSMKVKSNNKYHHILQRRTKDGRRPIFVKVSL